MTFRKFVSFAALTLASAAALAQQPTQQQPAPEQIRAIMQTTMDAMVSMMGPLTEAILEAQLSVAARPETAERLAQFKKNLYDSLINKGFSPADALQITIAGNPPSAAPSTK
jgi:hypothetical protein